MSIRLVAATVIFGVAACGGGSKKGDTTVAGAVGASGDTKANDDLRIPKVDPALCDTKGKRQETFDLDGDKRPDVWKIYATTKTPGTTRDVLTCKQVDLDHNGKKDYVARFDESGVILSEEYDFDYDGVFDARVHYDLKTHKKYLVERETGFDKKPDVWEKYDGEERLESVRRDQNLDGKPDTWEHYRAGVLEKIQWDDDFDGIVDRQEEAKAPPAPAPPAPETGTEVPPEEPPADLPATEAPKEDAKTPAPEEKPATTTTKKKGK